MCVCEDERQAKLFDAVQARAQDHDLVVAALLDTPPRMDVFHHHREGSEIEGYVVGQYPPWRYRDAPGSALVDQVSVANVHVLRCLHVRICAVQTVVQNLRQVVAMDDTPNQSLLWIQSAVDHLRNIPGFTVIRTLAPASRIFSLQRLSTSEFGTKSMAKFFSTTI
jgi:hypothetical protein